MTSKTDAAERVLAAWVALQERVFGKGRFPVGRFDDLFEAVKEYVEVTEGDDLIHRDVAGCVSVLRDYLQALGRRIPGKVVYNADRLECMLFSGYDPHFEGDEPPGL